MLPTRNLGALTVPAIGYGAMVLSPGVYGEVDDETGLRALRHAFDAGATFVDTADGYGPDGHNERLVGAALRGRRDEIVVATKFGFRIPPGAGAHPFPVEFAFGELAVNTEPRYVRGYAEDSLRRLGTDRIDLYYPHYPDPQVPIEDTVGAVADLIRDGLVLHLGLSNVDADQLRRAHGVHPVAAVQVEWSLFRPIDPALLATARELGVGMVAWGPLGTGLLTGDVRPVGPDDFRRHMDRFAEANLASNMDRYAPLRALAADLAITPGQLALAWLLHQYASVVPIPGSRQSAHIDENLRAALVDLPPETLAQVKPRAVAPGGG